MRLILSWILSAIALLAVSYLLPGIHVTSFGTALLAAVILGLVNAVVRPVLVILTIPLTIVTLGLFLLVINALMFWLASGIIGGFFVDGFWWALLGALVYSFISSLLVSLVHRDAHE